VSAVDENSSGIQARTEGGARATDNVGDVE